jgi:flagellar L-ring protein precursor FlgH
MIDVQGGPVMKHSWKYPWIPVFAVFICFSATGCSTFSTADPVSHSRSIQTEPSVTPFVKPPAPSEGSLWTESSPTLFSDIKARQVGDTVIVDIVENTSSSLDANTKTSKSTSMDAGVTDLFGLMAKLNRKYTDLTDNGSLVGATVANSYNGKGTSDRKGQVTATIAARVIEVFPNRNIAIWGKREMKVNNETQFITVSGIIRQGDIDSTNHVASTYLADAKIEYSGSGVLADKQRVGWLTRILDNIWPF